MIILPAIDIIDRKPVRLYQGDYAQKEIVGSSVMELAKNFEQSGAEYIHLVDLDGAKEGKRVNHEIILETAHALDVPVEVGGGIRTVDDFREILRAGADKISINSSAVKNPDLVNAAAEKYGSQCVVVAIDARANAEMPSGFEVYVAGGRTPTGKDAVAWAKEVYERGAGEILLTSMDKDGTKSGFDLKLTKAVVEVVGIPVIASGGCGSLEHFSEVFEKTGCDAALAASLFHYRELTVGEVKEHLKEKGIPVRK